LIKTNEIYAKTPIAKINNFSLEKYRLNR